MASVTLPILFLKHTNTLGKGFSSSQRNVIAGLNFSIGVVDKIAEIFTAHLKRTKAGSTTRIYPMSSQVHPHIEFFTLLSLRLVLPAPSVARKWSQISISIQNLPVHKNPLQELRLEQPNFSPIPPKLLHAFSFSF